MGKRWKTSCQAKFANLLSVSHEALQIIIIFLFGSVLRKYVARISPATGPLSVLGEPNEGYFATA
jgi:hypothetical protein